MQTLDTNMVLLAAFGLFVIYLLAMMLAIDGWVLYRLLTGQRILPAAPLVARRPVPWGLWTVLSLVAMTLILPIGVYLGYAKANGLMPRRSAVRPPAGKAVAPAAPPTEKQAQPAEKPAADPASAKKPAASPEASAANDAPLFLFTENLAIGALSNSILLILAPLVLRLTTSSPLRDLGLSFKRWWRQVAIGVLALLAIDPLLLGTQLLMTRIWKDNPHPLFEMIRKEFSPGVPQLAILLAVVVAPIWEELLFRGVIQSWMIRRFQRRPTAPARLPAEILAVAAAPEAGLPSLQSNPEVSDSSGEVVFLPESAFKPLLPGTEQDFPNPWSPPHAELSAQAPERPVTPGERRIAAFAGITITSLIFAMLHFEQWPAPIALFPLSVAIGYVYEKTGSFIAAFCMHATFNGLSTMLLLMSLLAPEPPHRPKVEKANVPTAVAGFSTASNCVCTHVEK